MLKIFLYVESWFKVRGIISYLLIQDAMEDAEHNPLSMKNNSGK